MLASDKDLPLTRVLPMTQLMRDAVARQRVSTVILAVFSAVAMLLAAVGFYGVVSHSVTERTREIGVRMALGAERGQVLGLFVLHGLATAALGPVCGLAARSRCRDGSKACCSRSSRRTRDVRRCSAGAARRRGGGVLPARAPCRAHRSAQRVKRGMKSSR